MKVRLVLSAALLAAVAPMAAQAQVANPFSLEVRGGAGIPMGEFAEKVEIDEGISAQVQTGWGFAVNGAYRFMPVLGAYAGFSYNKFELGLDGVPSLPGVDVGADFVDSGFSAGLIAYFPAPMLEPWVRGGVIMNQLKQTMRVNIPGFINETETFTSDRSFGFEVGGGLAVPLAPRISLTPGVIYRSYKPKFTFEGESFEDETLSDLSVDVGLRIRF